MARMRPDDPGSITSRAKPQPRRRCQGVARNQVLQRQRSLADRLQLLDRLRSRPAPVRLGPASREVRVYAHFVEAILWVRTTRARALGQVRRGNQTWQSATKAQGSIGSTNPTKRGPNAAGFLFENFVGGSHKKADFVGSSPISPGEGKYHLLFDLFGGRELQMKLGESPEQPSRQVLPMSCLGGPMMILRHLEIGHPVQNPLNCYAGFGPSKRLSDA